MTIYLDVLVLINIYVTYFLLKATEKILSLKFKTYRLVLASFLGGLFSLLIMVKLNYAELFIIKILMGLSLVFITYSKKNVRMMLKIIGVFLIVNFIFAGFMLGLWYFVFPKNMAYKNGIPYFNVSALTLLVSTALAYLVIVVFTKFLNRRNKKDEICLVKIKENGREIEFKAFLDTGNKLVDMFSGNPVIVCRYDTIKDILPMNLKEFFKDKYNKPIPTEENVIRKRVKMIPITTAKGESILPSFKPEEIIVNEFAVTAVIAVSTERFCDDEYEAVLNPKLLQQSEVNKNEKLEKISL